MDQRIVSGTPRPLVFYLVQPSDHRSPATGQSPVVLLSKNGGAFAPAAGAVTELGDGWYQTAANAGDSGAIGPLIVHVSGAAGFDPYDSLRFVVPALSAAPYYQNSAASPYVFLMVLSSDHATGAAGITPSVVMAQPGNSFAAPVGAIQEIGGAGNGFGWYKVAPNTGDFATAGTHLLHATGAGCDDTDEAFDVAPVGSITNVLSSLLTSVQNLTITSGLFTANTARVTVEPNDFPTTSGPYCMVRPGAHDLDNPNWRGAGVYNAEYAGRVEVWVIARKVSDVLGTDSTALLTPTSGLVDQAVSLANFLNGEFPVDGHGNQLTQKPIFVSRIGEPNPTQARSSKDILRDWRAIVLSLAIDWMMPKP